MINTLLVDIDDTLLDFGRGERRAFRLTFAQLGLPYRRRYLDIYHRINVAWWARYDRGEVPLEVALAKRLEESFGEMGLQCPPDFGDVYAHHLRDQHPYMPGARHFVRWAKQRGLTLCAVSNGLATVQSKRLKESGLDKMLDCVVVSQDAGYHKPQLEFFQYMSDRMGGLQPSDCILIGDSLTSDIAGGNGFGCPTIWFNPHRKPALDIVPTATAHSWRGVIRHLCHMLGDQ